ncbi:MAG: 30S ribosomal protein S18 [Candidatus Kerfeldbacteria bacterium RIFCSPLOWO2_01_FULL_48_11]|uniref:Small ribosomal subunit protein bS18 n=1 Tax=Candidatus Kerfeldbacteria bacterium RIFCSPLOWO2_01_FULL_48_11 TaxID=1798543 RepID=A0A1G2B450_9BACT|nr:MAG: 30S ribosomal protein S18 [Parcubacteria group bacterium GW2011_GWA2_48_9]KKW16538.1 MAG: 30S ribosomal protein S18 [Parcubacteria group bacterium GW2011_GWC2_49_9]OGY83962.1 MAG: 30S ribosomal protein S18 [Candidatus Kerfeldbacteria bacterium RIFCSPLOWO2_01_FULL_48_11]HCJ52750.1 30S ribosomal protein S18 [Candidatus Kerfeldbacteria bacterium]HCM68758.1 30S ribosomal protein S18 [Candidatus Kerfeldbacteria bacterium]
MPRQQQQRQPIERPTACHFCINAISDIDYKESRMLRKFTSSYGKILPRRKTSVCAKHQRKLARAVKHARMMALLPFTTR